MRWGVVVIALCACGRLQFDPLDTPDAQGGDDAAIDPDSSRPFACPAFALLCDDFETGDISKWSSTIGADMSTVDASTELPYEGAYSLHSHMAMQGFTGSTEMVGMNSTSLLTGTVAIRAYLRSPRALVDYEGQIVFSQDFGFSRYAEVDCSDESDGDVWAITEFPAPGIVDHLSTRRCVANTWECVELDYTYNGRMQLYVDDQMLVDVPVGDTANPGYKLQGVGIARATLNPLDVYVDNVVIADRHIGCD